MTAIIQFESKPTKAEFEKYIKLAQLMGNNIELVGGELKFYNFFSPFIEQNINEISKKKGREPLASWPMGCIYYE